MPSKHVKRKGGGDGGGGGGGDGGGGGTAAAGERLDAGLRGPHELCDAVVEASERGAQVALQQRLGARKVGLPRDGRAAGHAGQIGRDRAR